MHVAEALHGVEGPFEGDAEHPVGLGGLAVIS